MRIGILTQPLHTNYGGLLQAYALQRTLIELGHDVLTIDISTEKSFAKKTIDILSEIKNEFPTTCKIRLKQLVDHYSNNHKKIISQNTNAFIDNYINKTTKLTSIKKIKCLQKYNFDAYIVGSDQVWRPKYSPDILTFYLNFLGNDNRILRIAYAASFGVDHWEYTTELTSKCKMLAQLFDSISVREDSAVNLCKSFLNVEAIHVLDPTMLLQPSHYQAIATSFDKSENTKPFIATYILDDSIEKQSIIRKTTNFFNLESIPLMPKSILEYESSDINTNYIYPSVEYWLKNIINCDFVISDSYHGAVFSIIFNKQFIIVGNPKRGLARITSLLRMFNLETRLVYDNIENLEDLFTNPIDYKHANEILSNNRDKSINFICNSLAIKSI
ncbi:polysaccharide pyruvyl transferase family protein [Desulfopila aestuarii]|uniref:Polysaccharide pyruvyl transferase n=1 Tax=Desulfopila aestuarii DSM 18488 TaxID=1121416 RepID=A0A1M7YFP9_9BACT|nr:polysaccharide pyruvyl transferase family protein [Desulfopila aestuarii]SHO51464.1 Polysaccharide pyruvyl transferase [Desulfopila aestuarii DSM 18488]